MGKRSARRSGHAGDKAVKPAVKVLLLGNPYGGICTLTNVKIFDPPKRMGKPSRAKRK